MREGRLVIDKLDTTTRQQQLEFLTTLYDQIYPESLSVNKFDLTELNLETAGIPSNTSYQPKFLLKESEVISSLPLLPSEVIKSGEPELEPDNNPVHERKRTHNYNLRRNHRPNTKYT